MDFSSTPPSQASRHIYDMIIIGGGPGGYAAALYAARAGLDTIVIEKLCAGGQMALTAQIDNYPGFEEGIDGYTLGEKMRHGAERFGAATLSSQVSAVSLHGTIKEIKAGNEKLYSYTVILATGAAPRILDLPGEQELRGKGVHYCAACDGIFYRGKRVAVIGGGNTAAEDALMLSKFCKEVILIHRRDTLKAEKIYCAALEKASNVTFQWNCTVTALLHDNALTGILVQNVFSGKEVQINCDGVFVSIGRVPATDFIKDQLMLDSFGYIPADDTTRTPLPGVFAVGDIRAKALRQIVTAVSDGAVAAHYAEIYLEEIYNQVSAKYGSGGD